MELYLNRQLYALVSSVLAGLFSGALYDLLRVFRQRLRLTAVFDLLFWLIVGFGLFYLGMSAGDGSLHVLMLFSAFVGFIIYMKLMSAAVFSVFDAAAELSAKLFEPLKKMFGKTGGFVTKCFFDLKERIKMHSKDGDGDDGQHTETDGAHSDRADYMGSRTAHVGADGASERGADDGRAHKGALSRGKRKRKAQKKARKARQ